MDVDNMDLARIKQQYDTLYTALGFERQGLFRLLQRQFNPREVVYLGSSIHVTPSFFFPHVRYVDNGAQSCAFFADVNAVQAFIAQHKQYRRAPYLQYVRVDYSSRMPGSFERGDLVLALYAPGALHVAANYLQRHGLLVYLPLPSDRDVALPAVLVQVGAIVAKGDSYRYEEGDRTPPTPSGRLTGGSPGRGERYRDDNVYGVYATSNA
jgi:hypothetical protein